MGNVSGWTETIVLTMLFVVVLTIAITQLNISYHKDYDLGLSSYANDTMFLTYIDNSQSNIKGGEVNFDSSQGITLKSSYGILMDGMNLVWNVLSGGFIEKIAEMLNAGDAGMAVARTFRILFVISLIFALLYALFKVGT